MVFDPTSTNRVPAGLVVLDIAAAADVLAITV
jgi:hypothetical protein